MTLISPTATSGVLPAYTDPNADFTGLTADALLSYCSSRLSTIDSTVQQYFVKQQKTNQDMRDAGRLMDILGKFTCGCGSSEDAGKVEDPDNKDKPKVDPAKKDTVIQGHVNMANDLLKAYQTTADPELRAKMEEAFKAATGKDLTSFIGKDGAPLPFGPGDLGTWEAKTKDQWDAFGEAVKNIQGSLSKTSELNMIQLQSLVSQRQLAVQITTQLMQTLHESAKQAVGNIR